MRTIALLLLTAAPTALSVRLLPCGLLTKDLVLTASEEYILACQLFVGPASVLNISAGVTVMALPTAGNAPAIVVERGGMIYALGTAAKPITLTAIDGYTASSALVSTDSRTSAELVTGRRGKWGGLVLLGRAPVNAPGGTSIVEGLRVPNHGGSDAGYGGSDPHDNAT